MVKPPPTAPGFRKSSMPYILLLVYQRETGAPNPINRGVEKRINRRIAVPFADP